MNTTKGSFDTYCLNLDQALESGFDELLFDFFLMSMSLCKEYKMEILVDDKLETEENNFLLLTFEL